MDKKQKEDSWYGYADPGKASPQQLFVVEEAQPSLITKRDSKGNIVHKQQKMKEITPTPPSVSRHQKPKTKK